MKLTVLGYWGGYPDRTGATSTYLLEHDGFTIVLDMGSGGLMTLMKYIDVTAIDAVLLSHYHADHIADVGVLQHALLVESYITEVKQPVPIYGHIEDREAFKALNHKYTKAVQYHEKETLKLGPFYIRFLKTNHPVPCYGMRITDGNSTLVYTADSGYQENWIPFCEGTDVLLADCNFYNGQEGSGAGHMTSAEVGEIAKEADAGEVILTHLPHYGDHQQLIKEARDIYQGKIMLAHEGLIWER